MKLAKKLARRLGNPQSGQTAAAWGCGAALVVGIIGVLAVLFSGANVSPGYVGVVSSLSGIDETAQPLDQGFHPVMPFVTHIESVSIQPQNFTFQEVQAASQTYQNVYVDGGVNYTIDSGRISVTESGQNRQVYAPSYLTVQGGADSIIQKVFAPAFQDFMKTEVPKFKTEEILNNRDTIRNEVKDQLSPLGAQYGLIVTNVFITNIHFDKAYTDAIEQKSVAQQKLEQAQIEADTAVTVASGQAKANAALNASLTPTLIAWQELQIQQQEIAKWNGVMPQVVGSANPFISITAGTSASPAPSK